MKKSTHLKEIAYELGLSVNTISRALRDCNDISEKTKNLVREKAFEMGYIPNTMSQFIKNQKKLIGVIANNLANHYVVYQIENLSRTMKKYGYSFTIIFCDEYTVDKEVFKRCLAQRVDAVISFTTPDKEFLELAKYNYMPVVFLGQLSEDFDDLISTVYVDNEMGSLFACNYMFNKHKGNKYITIGYANLYDSIKRIGGIKDHLKELHKDHPFEIVELNANELNANELLKLLSEGYNNVFCFNDDIAYEAIGLLNQSVPDFRRVFPQFHIIGCDALCTKFNCFHDLSSIDFDASSIVENALEIIHKAFYEKGYINHVMIPCKLHQRR